jgi:hypothetical protein
MARRPLATASKVSGIGQRWTFGPLADRPREDAIAELHAVNRDHVVLGHALVAVQLDGWPGYDRLAELYRAAGADAQVAASELAWQRDYRPEYRSRR